MPKVKADKAIIIARVSTEEQADEKHHSIPAQLKNLRDYAKKNKFNVIEELEIKGESASKGKRKIFSKAFKIVEASDEPIAILVDKVDRFQRGFKETVKADDLRKDGKLELHFVGQGLVIHRNSTASELIIWDALVMAARMYILQISDNVKRSIKHILEQGHFPGYVPTGYLNVTKENGTKEIIQDPERKDLIKETFSLYATGDYSVEELTKVIRNKGLTIKAKKGREPRPVDKSDLLWVLNNRFYTGTFEWVNPNTVEREVYVGTNYEPLIDEDMFNSVRQILNKKSIKYSTRHSSTKFYKFRGLISCGFCGCVMTPMDLSTNYKNKKPGEKIYYRCTYQKKSIDPEYYKKKFGENHSGVSERKKKITKGKYSDEKEKIYNCPQMYWKEEEIEGEIKRYLKSLKYDADVFRQIKEKLNQEFQARISISEAQRKSLEIDLNKKEKLRTGLVRKIAMEDDLKEVIPDLKAELVKVKKEMEDIEREIKFIKEMEDADIEEVTSVLELTNDLYAQYDKLSNMDKRRLITTAFKRISVKRGKVDATKYNSVDMIWTEPFLVLYNKFLLEYDDNSDDENEPNPSTTPSSGSFNKSKDSPRRLSGHGFSPQERRANDEWELIFLAGENQRVLGPLA